MDDKTFPGPVQIPLSTAEKWTKAYNDDATTEDNKKKIKAFLIPRESLEKVLALDTEAVRAYIGLNEKEEKTLLFVGAKLDKETGIYKDVFGSLSIQEKSELAAVPSVYDASRPCPPYGDPSSSL